MNGKRVAPVFFPAGSSAVVQATRHALIAAGVYEDAVRSEEFNGH